MKNFTNTFGFLVLLFFILSGCRKDGDELILGGGKRVIL